MFTELCERNCAHCVDVGMCSCMNGLVDIIIVSLLSAKIHVCHYIYICVCVCLCICVYIVCVCVCTGIYVVCMSVLYGSCKCMYIYIYICVCLCRKKCVEICYISYP